MSLRFNLPDPTSRWLRCWVEVDGRALRHNLKRVREMVPKNTRVLVVLKANAYGHGLIPVAKEYFAAGADWFGVANLDEGAALREAGITSPILMLSAALPAEMEEAIRHDLDFTISSLEEATELNRTAQGLGEQASIHFKIDTGMGRLGCWHEEAAEVLKRISGMSHIALSGLMTHFSAADDSPKFTLEQWGLIKPFFDAHPNIVRHAANSPAVLGKYGYGADLVRVGLSLFGAVEDPTFHPALIWKSRIALIRDVGPGRSISYGGTYRTTHTERHAIVAAGYGDGYFRKHTNGAGMLVHGQLCPIRGRVTMDQVVLDVSHVPCRVGDEVVLLGRQLKAEIKADALAKEADTIPWEILTNISSRVKRVYHHFETSEPA